MIEAFFTTDATFLIMQCMVVAFSFNGCSFFHLRLKLFYQRLQLFFFVAVLVNAFSIVSVEAFFIKGCSILCQRL